MVVLVKARRPLIGRPPANSHDHVRVADAAVARIRAQWLDLLREVGDSFDPGHAAHLAAFTTPAITASATAPELPVAKKLPSLAGLATSLSDVASRVARRVLGGPTITRTATVGWESSFHLVNDQAVTWAQQRAGQLVLAVDDQTRQTIAQLVARGQQGDLAVDEIARQVKPLIGLTTQQANAAWNYRDALISRQVSDRYGQDAAAVLRNQFVLSPWRGGPLTGRVDKLWNQYIDRQLRWRAENIARTESIAAATQGRRLAWSDEIARGGADGYSVVQEWSVTADDRACPECLGLDGERIVSPPVGPGLRPDVESMGTFPGGLDGPPAHSMCRCVTAFSLE